MRSALRLGAAFLLIAAALPPAAQRAAAESPAETQAEPDTGAAPAGEALSGEALRREVSGSTIGGFHVRSFMRFSEYHSPDGRIFGHNGGIPVDRGCWDVVSDEVCYYYEGDTLPQGTWCWTFHRLAKRGQYRLEHRLSGGLALAVREPGNPRSWSDNGKEWRCTPLTSQRRGPQSFAQGRP